MRPRLAKVPGMSVFLQNPPTIRIDGQLTKSLYQYTLSGTDFGELAAWTPKIEDKFRGIPILQDVTTDLQITSPQVIVNINRDKAQSLDVTADQIENALYDAYGNRQDLDHLHALKRVLRHHGGAAEIPARPAGTLKAVRLRSRRQAHSAGNGGHADPHGRPAHRESHRPIAVDHGFLQSAPRRLAEPGSRRH